MKAVCVLYRLSSPEWKDSGAQAWKLRDNLLKGMEWQPFQWDG